MTSLPCMCDAVRCSLNNMFRHMLTTDFGLSN